MTELAIVIISFDRPIEIRQTIYALEHYLKYSGPQRWIIADDGSPEGQMRSLKIEFAHLHPLILATQRGGWGRNVNNALRWVRDHGIEYIFLCEDDYMAMTDIDLDSGAEILGRHPQYGLVRYDGLAGHDLLLHLTEVDIHRGRTPILEILLQSRHLNIYSNRPHLRHRRFTDHYGLYPEGLPLGATEESYAHCVRDRYENGPKIISLANGIVRAFNHIGASRQGTEYDRIGNEYESPASAPIF